jgi:hypothetical protein
MTTRLHDVVFDCRHPASLARFWAAVLDGYEVAPYDDDEIERLRTMGIDDVEDDPSVLVEIPGRTPRGARRSGAVGGSRGSHHTR